MHQDRQKCPTCLPFAFDLSTLDLSIDVNDLKRMRPSRGYLVDTPFSNQSNRYLGYRLCYCMQITASDTVQIVDCNTPFLIDIDILYDREGHDDDNGYDEDELLKRYMFIALLKEKGRGSLLKRAGAAREASWAAAGCRPISTPKWGNHAGQLHDLRLAQPVTSLPSHRILPLPIDEVEGEERQQRELFRAEGLVVARSPVPWSVPAL